jgi:hypothetical protein
MSCSAPPVGGSADMYGGKTRTKRRHYHERMGATAVLGTAALGVPILGMGRKKTRRTRWRYIRGIKIRVSTKSRRKR